MTAQESIWIIAAVATTGVILRPFNWPEAIWAVAGAALLVALQLISPQDVLNGVAKGTDVYLFLLGMMLLAEIARAEGLFDWLAAIATSRARGSARRLFALIYGVGIVVTVFLSNDATAVVLTPAVAAAVKAAKAEKPLPYLLICAFIANAASFVLPISNPANLVIYGNHMPPLQQWLPAYLVPSVLAIAATYVVLRWTQRRALDQKLAMEVPVPVLTPAGKTAAIGIAATACVLLASSAADMQLGLPTAIAGMVTAVIVLIRERKPPWRVLRDISWGVLPLVAGSAVQGADVSDQVTRAILIGVDLGPNLSVTGSLATILWLTALRREGQVIGAGAFLKLGVLVMPPALALAIAAAVLLP